MKNAILTLALAGATLFGGLATAQDAIFDVNNASAEVTFYDGNPANGGDVLETATMNNSPVAKRISNDDVRDYTKYLTLEIDGEMYTVETFGGGSSKNSIYLDIGNVDRDDAMTLGEFLDEVAEDPSVLEQL